MPTHAPGFRPHKIFDPHRETPMPFMPATNCDITIDVSHHQGNIDWAAVKETGIGCVMIKATQGLTKDSRWEINRDGARQQGLLVIPYTFLTTAVKAAEQAEFFI